MNLTEQELATLRAALHCWQNELSYYTTEELRDYYPDLRGHVPLSIDDVERLLAQLQSRLLNRSGEPTADTQAPYFERLKRVNSDGWSRSG